jgi:2,4-dienoyl-CoA reductase (NADPH2)
MGNWLYIAERMKKNIKAPVSMAYRLFVPEIPEKAIAEGKLDMWEMCRPMIADPFLPKKIMEDRQQDIIPCMQCLSGPAIQRYRTLLHRPAFARA